MTKIQKSRVGIVEKISGQKTIRVVVERLVKEPKYKKYIKRRRVFLVHDPHQRARVGDRVLIKEGRRVSKLKSWYLAEIIQSSSESIETSGESVDEAIQ